MTYSEWSYSATQAEPPEMTSANPAVIDALVQRDLNASKSDSTYRTSSAGTLNGINTYPVVRTNGLPDQWHVADPAADVPAYVPGDGGIIRQITLGYRDMTYLEAKRHARDVLEVYYIDYRASHFQAATVWYSAGAEQSARYIQDMVSTLRTPGTFPPVVLDWEFNAVVIPDEPGWQAFYTKFENLGQTAFAISEQAWSDIKGVATTAEVAAIIAALPPIPEPV